MPHCQKCENELHNLEKDISGPTGGKCPFCGYAVWDDHREFNQEKPCNGCGKPTRLYLDTQPLCNTCHSEYKSTG
jgi:hypothetical protein